MSLTQLDDLIRWMEPIRRPGEYVFVDATSLPLSAVVEASVREAEGPSAVISRTDADQLGLHYDFVSAWLALSVDSSLAAVGLTAIVSTELARIGVSCNVIAGLRHDHLLVPADSADDALAALRLLMNEPS